MSTPSIQRLAADHGQPTWTVTLRDGSSVLIRPINKLDKGIERAFIVGLTQESRRYRFLGSIGTPSERMIEDLTDIDHNQQVALVALVQEGTDERIVGVCRYGTSNDGQDCESAVTVEEDWQDKGLGTALMNHLIDIARTRGIRRMYSIDSAENRRMNDLARHLGFQTSTDPNDSTQVIHQLDL
ncbi:MAG: GNAT family N-acetyltransferase [Thermomonas sp.]